jgi:hypothetical protein
MMKPFWLVVLLLACGFARADDLVTVTPRQDAAAVLHNPDMGWVLYENYPVDHRPNGSSTMLTLPDEKFDGGDQVAVMFSWADVERREGEYDFAAVDRAYDYWHARGKQVQLRMSTESLLYWGGIDPPGGKGIPDYVLARVPAERKQTRKLDDIEYVVVDARDAFYLERLEKFLAAVAAHFAPDRRPVTLIDLRGFGVWGEWHSGYRYASPQNKRIALRGIIDRWSTAFPKQYLAMSCSYDPDSPGEYFAGPTDHFDAASTDRYADYLRYSAFDYALTKPNVTFRRDGVGGAVHSNERRLMDETFATLAKGPMSCEFIQFYSQAKGGGGKWLDALLDDALSLHPNYINLLGYAGPDALAFLREQPELIARGLRSMGYRLLPTRVAYPAVVRAGETFTVQTTWTNQGVGRAMRDFHLVFSIGEATRDAGATGSDRWIKGKTSDVSSRVKFGNLPPCEYPLRIGLTDGDHPIALPLRDGDGRSYPVGTITIRP